MKPETIEEILITGLDDWIHLADVAWLVRSGEGCRTKDEIVSLSLGVIRYLLEAHLIEIGDVTGAGFVSWDLPIDASVERVREAWQRLDRDPMPGEICWLATTSNGDHMAQEALRRRGLSPS